MALPALLQDKQVLDNANRMATALAHSDMVGPTLKGSVANCLTAMLLAAEMDESAVMVLQNIYFVHGRAAWLSQYMVGRAARCHVFKGPLRWRVEVDGADWQKTLSVTCYADLRDAPPHDDRVDITLDYATAVESGWTTYFSKSAGEEATHARWKTLPMATQMLRWRTAAWLIRLYAPHVMMGLPVVDELDHTDIIDITPPPQPKISELAEWPDRLHPGSPTERADTSAPGGPPGETETGEGATEEGAGGQRASVAP